MGWDSGTEKSVGKGEHSLFVNQSRKCPECRESECKSNWVEMWLGWGSEDSGGWVDRILGAQTFHSFRQLSLQSRRKLLKLHGQASPFMVTSFVEMVGKTASGLECLETVGMRTLVLSRVTVVVWLQYFMSRTLWASATEEVLMDHVSIVVL